MAGTNSFFKRAGLLLAVAFSTTATTAAIKLPHLFSDNMVKAYRQHHSEQIIKKELLPPKSILSQNK